jgi:hypothetical protein
MVMPRKNPLAGRKFNRFPPNSERIGSAELTILMFENLQGPVTLGIVPRLG